MFREDCGWFGRVRIFRTTFFVIRFRGRTNDVKLGCRGCGIITFLLIFMSALVTLTWLLASAAIHARPIICISILR
jgi:hypothetical protein